MFVKHLKKQAAFRGEDTQKSVEQLHQQLKNAEAMRSQVRSQLDRAEMDVARSEREAAAEAQEQEQQLADLTAAYQRLERQVFAHLKGLQQAVAGEWSGSATLTQGSGIGSGLQSEEGKESEKELEMLAAMEKMNVKLEMDLAAAAAAVEAQKK